MSARTERRKVDRGEWMRPLPGVVSSGSCEGAEITAAALLRAGPDALLCERTAAQVWLDREIDGDIHITVAHGDRIRRVAGVVFHQSATAPRPFSRHGWPVTGPARTAAGVAAGPHPEADRRALVTGLVQLGLLTSEQFAAAAAHTRLRVRSQVRRLVEEVRAGALSGPEARLWRGQVQARLPVPVLNEPVEAAGRRRAIDGYLPELRAGYEVQGREHHAGTWLADTARMGEILVGLSIVLLPLPVPRIERDLDTVLAELAQFWRNRAFDLGVPVPTFRAPP